MPAIDIVLPLYKPHGEWHIHIIECIQALSRYFAGKNISLRYYIVNDGALLEYYPQDKLDAISSAANGNFRFLSYEPNRGKGYAIRFAVAQTTGAYQIYTDGDFPFGWESVAAAADQLTAGANVAMGVRGKEYTKAVGGYRKYISRTVLLLNRFLLGIPSKNADTQAGMKGFDAKGKAYFLQTKTDSFVFDMEFILLAHRAGLKITTVPLTLRRGIVFSRMGLKTMLRELGIFAKILWRIRILGKDRSK